MYSSLACPSHFSLSSTIFISTHIHIALITTYGCGGGACLLHIHMAPQEVTKKFKIQEKIAPDGSVTKPEAFIRT